MLLQQLRGAHAESGAHAALRTAEQEEAESDGPEIEYEEPREATEQDADSAEMPRGSDPGTHAGDGPTGTMKKEILVEKPHKVQHLKLLNNDNFWWLMGALIFFVAVAVVTIEVSEKQVKQRDSQEPAAQKALMVPAAPESSPGAPAKAAPSKKESKPKGTALQLAMCVVGLNVCMLLWGVSQEFVMTNTYKEGGHGPGEQIPSALFLVLCNRMGSIVFSVVLSFFIGEPLFTGDKLAFATAAMPALSNLCASWSQYASISYISFPLQTTAKSAKMLPVLVVSSLRGKKQTLLDYAEAVVITCAVIVFGLEDGEDASFEMQGKGVLLVCGMMFFDSVTPHMQDFLFQRYPNMMVIQANFAMSCLASLVCVLILTIDGQLIKCFMFMQRHNTAVLHVSVLALCSTLTQFLITYTIKRFGPVIFILIVTTRQVISVCLSSLLFMHQLTSLAIIAAAMVFGTVMVRTLWRLPEKAEPAPVGAVQATSGLARTRQTREDDSAQIQFWFPPAFRGCTDIEQLLVCAVAVHVPLCLWAIAQEFMATHTFKGQLFHFSLFMIAMNRMAGIVFALWVLYLRRLPLCVPSLKLASLPAAANFFATASQYQALYYIRFPQQTLMKTLKVIPVMLCGRIMRNRSYQALEYFEAFMVTGIVAFFVYYGLGTADFAEGISNLPGVILMCGYIMFDSLTSNFEDWVYQVSKVDPAHLMLGNEILCAVVSWMMVICSGQLFVSVDFILEHQECIPNLCMLVMASACGCYACLVTVRLFGPAVFTLIMMSRQVLSLVISVILFQHPVDNVSCLCLVVVSMLILTSTLRKVSAGHDKSP